MFVLLMIEAELEVHLEKQEMPDTETWIASHPSEFGKAIQHRRVANMTMMRDDRDAGL